MIEVIDAPIDIVLTADGEPASFILNRFEYDIHGQPQAHYSRAPWWNAAAAPDRIDTEYWRVDAGRTIEDLTRYDLRREIDGAWYLAAAWR